MTVKQLIAAMVQATNIYKINYRDLGVLTGYSMETVRKWTKGNVSLVHYVDWANSLGYDVKIVRKSVR